MDFSKRKLPKEAAENLRTCPIDTVKPYAPMLAPVYVLMTKNEKFVSVKAPLDFFTPEELERLKSFQLFYVPEFIESVLPFRQAARSVKALLTWRPDVKDPMILPPASFELSDSVLRVIGPLWGRGGVIEPFFVAAFANELCDLLPSELLVELRERSVDLYETAMFRAGWAVFLALHLGYCEMAFLNELRLEVFKEVASGKVRVTGYRAIDELMKVARATLSENRVRQLTASEFLAASDRVVQKLKTRITRINLNLIQPDAPVPTIFGERGFVDA